jgi:hypothetical protein
MAQSVAAHASQQPTCGQCCASAAARLQPSHKFEASIQIVSQSLSARRFCMQRLEQPLRAAVSGAESLGHNHTTQAS